MPPMTQSNKSRATRQTILDTGHALVLRKGFAALGLQEILTASNVPKGSFYYYFASKEAFGAALLQQYVDRYAERLDALNAMDAPDGRARLVRYFQAWLAGTDSDDAHGWAEGCLAVKLSAEVADLSEPMRCVLSDGIGALLDRIAAMIVAARADGSLPDGAPPAALAQVLYQMWLGAALLAKLTRSRAPMEQALGATEQLLCCNTLQPKLKEQDHENIL